MTAHLAYKTALVALCLVSPFAANAQSPKPGGELGYGEGPPSLGSLNPYASWAVNGPTDRVMSMVYEPLFRFNFNVGEWENVLAANVRPVQPKKGKSAFAITLKQATWHDGKPFTAEDVQFTYDYIRAASVNTRERDAMRALIAEVRSDRDSPTVVVFEFNDAVPDPRFHLGDYIIPSSRFVRPAFNPAPGVKDLDQDPVGTGPYKVQFSGGAPVFSVNETYHGEKGLLAKLRYREFTDPSSMVETFLTVSQQIQLLVEAPPEQLPRIEASGNVTTKQLESYNVFAVAMRQNANSPLTNEKVRRALTMAVNGAQILKNWFIRGQLVASPVVPGSPFYDPTVQRLEHNPVQAKKDIAEAGAAGKTLTLVYPVSESGTQNRFADVARSIKEAIEQVGMTVVERPLKAGSTFDQTLLKQGDFDLALVRWEFNPAYDITPLFLSTNAVAGGANYMKFNDPNFDRYAREYATATDPNRRQSLMRAMQKLLNEKAPAIFLVNEEKTYAYYTRYRIPDDAVDPFHFFTYATRWWLSQSTSR